MGWQDRTVRLIGEEAAERLNRARVAVFGVGGVGSFVAEALVRAGVGTLLFVDGDRVEESNLNRQLIATRANLGTPKAEAARARALSINPDADITALNLFYDESTADQIDLCQYDFVADCIDSVPSKLLLIERAKSAGCRVVCAMGAGNKLDPTKLEVADIYDTSVCRLARVMRRELRRRNIPKLKCVYSREPSIEVPDGAAACKKGCVCPPGSSRTCLDRRAVPGSVSFVPSVAGLIIASEVVRDLVAAKA